jgi:hypothetical protein
MPIPSTQVSPYECVIDDATAGRSARDVPGPDSTTGDLAHGARAPPVHLTMTELAQRWKRTRKTIERRYSEWGLRPLRFGGRLLFPLQQVLDCEQRAMEGEFVNTTE